ncbi:NAD(P)/FAD-dependent oxidoreductase [Scleromatobacter humisilvae]|uniref:FAD-binding oxidoreductase n=1 Tax=Scleromatobacter humisilvae TaxID=2897159 RepID=A0A9X1YP85_9BURK|nr:FAD-binding oxidoreductase [Scleromatobacter humisilvae]MCK9688630.1 FAD-binding oxidoreductase [Scleromatobacter humisilvae]
MNPKSFDFIVIGAGIAGASMAAHLAQRGRVLLLEGEDQPGYHTTGRSAALFSTIYGNAPVRALSRASRDFLFQPPPGFSDVPLVHPRPTLFFARPDQLALLDELRADADVRAGTRLLDAAEAWQLLPVFRPGFLGGGMIEDASADMDVHAMHQGYLRGARRLGAELVTARPVLAMTRDAGLWRVQVADGHYEAPIVVNAAGAWGDLVARAAGVAPVGLRPLRRTAMVIDAPDGLQPNDWPAAIAADESFYFRPEAGRLLLSPADETPSEPCDAQPDEWDVAVAVDHFERAIGRPVARVLRRWAGLRVFTDDRSPVAGFAPDAPGFFWFVGQGGYGIQMAEGLARAGAALACGEALPATLVAHGVNPDDLSPARASLRAADPSSSSNS